MIALLCKLFGHDWKKMHRLDLRVCQRCRRIDEPVVADFMAQLRKVMDKQASR